MRVSRTAEPRPEAMADVPGVCELPLTRAVVLYRDVHEIDQPGGRIQDIGMAVVVEGRFASSARVIDLGSGQAKYLDLSAELVVLDWVYDPTLAHIRFLADGVEESPDEDQALVRYCSDLGIRILNRVGFNPLTRSTVLRIGFRDICRDLDLHEGTAVRIHVGDAGVVRVHLDYDKGTLVFRSAAVESNPPLESALLEVFRGCDVRRVLDNGPYGPVSYHARFGVPLDYSETRKVLGKMRRGLNHLVARFEPQRFEAMNDLTDTFGERGTLDRLSFRETRATSHPVQSSVRGSTSAIH